MTGMSKFLCVAGPVAVLLFVALAVCNDERWKEIKATEKRSVALTAQLVSLTNALAGLDDRVAALSNEVWAIGQRLDRIGQGSGAAEPGVAGMGEYVIPLTDSTGGVTYLHIPVCTNPPILLQYQSKIVPLGVAD